jgi:hypothetical protein
MLETVGRLLDVRSDKKLEQCYTHLRSICDNRTVTNRVRFLIENLLDLRKVYRIDSNN